MKSRYLQYVLLRNNKPVAYLTMSLAALSDVVYLRANGYTLTPALEKLL